MPQRLHYYQSNVIIISYDVVAIDACVPDSTPANYMLYQKYITWLCISGYMYVVLYAMVQQAIIKPSLFTK